MNVEEFHNRLRELYSPPRDQFSVVDVPEIRFAVVDGSGNPEGDKGAEAAKWLYSVAHMVKPLVKERLGKNFVDPPLEWLYWADNEKDFSEGDRDTWKWRAMVACVDWISPEQFDEAVAVTEQKRGTAPETLRLENLHEGRCVQIMHVGEYKEISTICNRLYNDYLPENDLKPHGRYHEIYLNDPARTAPDKRKIVIRQPVS